MPSKSIRDMQSALSRITDLEQDIEKIANAVNTQAEIVALLYDTVQKLLKTSSINLPVRDTSLIIK